MGQIMFNGESYGGDSGDDHFRYVNDVNDENYGWIQYQLEDGTWVNYEQLASGEEMDDGKLWLVKNGTNCAEFTLEDPSSYATLQEGDVLTLSDSHTSSGSHYMRANSKTFDVTSYTKLHITYTTILSYFDNMYDVVVYMMSADTGASLGAIFLVPKPQNPTNATYSGEHTMDTSEMTGECYVLIRIELRTGRTITLEISDMYLE